MKPSNNNKDNYSIEDSERFIFLTTINSRFNKVVIEMTLDGNLLIYQKVSG
jgi:hypothetical protein